MTQQELQQYVDRLAQHATEDALYVSRRFTALPESGSVSTELEYRHLGMLRDREPDLKEILTHPRIAIVADPGGGKSVVARAVIRQIIVDGTRVPLFAEVKEYRGNLALLLQVLAPPALLDLAETIDGAAIRRTYVLDGIDEIPPDLLLQLGAEIRQLIEREPEAHIVLTARQAFYVSSRHLLPPIPTVFQILPLGDKDIQSYAERAGIEPTEFWKSVNLVGAANEIRNPFVLSIMVERFRRTGALSDRRSENLSFVVDSLTRSRPALNPHQQRRALRMLAVAMETYSRNELTEDEALRVINEAMRIDQVQARALLDELYASILKRTANGLAFQLASYGEYLAAEALEDATMERIRELSFLDFQTPNETWLNTVSYLVELNPAARAAFARKYPHWVLAASPAAFSEHEKDTVITEILLDVTKENQLITVHPRIAVRNLAKFVTPNSESVLRKDLASQNEVVLGNALILLGIGGRSEVTPLAMDIVRDRGRSSNLRYCAVVALVNAGSPECVPELLALAPGDDLEINIVDAAGALGSDAQIPEVLPAILRTNAGLSATYYRFREFTSKRAVVELLRYFQAHPQDLNSIQARGYVEPVFEQIPKHWDEEVIGLVVLVLEEIETHQIYPDRSGPLLELFDQVRQADREGVVAQRYCAAILARGEEQRRRLYFVDQILAGLIQPDTARWLIAERATWLIKELAGYLQGEVRDILRDHSDGVIDAQEEAARNYRRGEEERERTRKSKIAELQARLLTRRELNEALGDFAELQKEHWPELPDTYREWLAREVSARLGELDLPRTVEWRGDSLWQPRVLPLLLTLIDRYELRIQPDEPLVFAATGLDQSVVNHYRRFGFSDVSQATFERLLHHPPSTNALAELVRFVERAQMWSAGTGDALRPVVSNRALQDYVRVLALNLLAEHNVEEAFLTAVMETGVTEELQRTAFMLLLGRNHRPTVERCLARLLANDQELKDSNVAFPRSSPLDWVHMIKADFAFDRLVQLRERALRLELPYVVMLFTNTLAAINRPQLAAVMRKQVNVAPITWRQVQLSQAIEQERTARIEAAQRTPFDEVIRKLKGATSLNRLLVVCEGATDVPVFRELIGQIEELPEVVFDDVGGWSGLRHKDPNAWLLGAKAVIVIMDGDEGRKLDKPKKPLTKQARLEEKRLAAFGIELHVLQRYGIENYFPQTAVEKLTGVNLAGYFPVPPERPFIEHLSRDNKGLRYRFRRWVASKLELRMPTPREPLFSKSRNEEVVRLISLKTDLAGTDLYEIIALIVVRAKEIRQG